MDKKHEEIMFHGFAPEKTQFACLLALAVMEVLVVTVFPLYHWFFVFPTENYLGILAMIFVGTCLVSKLPRSAVWQLLLGLAMVAWLALAQWLQYLMEEEPANISMWWTVYLLAFPFAAVTNDRAQKGLKLMAFAAIAASVISALYAVTLTLGIRPDFLHRAVYWDGEGRLVTLYHPIKSAWVFMMGIAFCVGFCFRTKKNWIRGLLVLAIAVQLWMQGLTNSRAASLMTCAIIAGAVFFSIFRGSWKRFLPGLLAACAVVGALYFLSDFVYDSNHDKLAAEISAQQAAEAAQAEQTEAADARQPDSATAETQAAPDVEQTHSAPLPEEIGTRNSFLKDLKSFTGRTAIWNEVFNMLRENPHFRLWGTAKTEVDVSDWFHAYHTHNAWLQMLLGFGVPGLLLALCFTFLAARSALWIFLSVKTDMWQKTVAMLVGAMLIAGTMEPFLFAADQGNHLVTVMFMLCIGYLEQWRLQLKQAKAENCTAA